MSLISWLVFIVAAGLEVCGDAVIRHGLRGKKLTLIVAGGATLAAYGLLVNLLRWDFSKLFSVYVGFFALVSILAGAIFFHEKISVSTWAGLLLIVTGCMVIQFGRQ